MALGFVTKLANPATLPTGTGQNCAVSPNGKWLAVVHSTSPFVSVYDVTTTDVLGTKTANPATLPAGTGRSVCWAPDSSVLVVGHSTSPFFSIYPFSDSGFGTKLTNPATLPTAQVNGCAFDSTGVYLLASHGSGFEIWTVIAGVVTYVSQNTQSMSTAGTAYGVGWSPDNAYAGAGHDTSPFITVYPMSAGQASAKVSNPATLPAGNGRGIRWNPAGTYVAVANVTTPFTRVYPWSGGAFGTAVADPGTVMAGNCSGVAWTSDGANLVYGGGTSPFVEAYTFSAGFGSKFANPSTLPTGAVNAGLPAILPWGGSVHAHSTTPFLIAYAAAVAGGGTTRRRSSSTLGTRAGSRQIL